MPELCDAACQKIIINSGLMAANADLLAETLGQQHPMFKPARVLAAASRAMCHAYDVAEEQGIIKRAGEASGWKECHQAAKIMEWVELVNNGGTMSPKSAEIMRTWTLAANKHTTALVSGRAPQA